MLKKIFCLSILILFACFSFVFANNGVKISYGYTPNLVLELSGRKTNEQINDIQKSYELCQQIFDERIKQFMVYPPKAFRRKISGNVVIRFTVSKEGTLSSLAVIDSDSPVLTEAAIALIKKVFPLGAKPLESFTDCVKICYKME